MLRLNLWQTYRIAKGNGLQTNETDLSRLRTSFKGYESTNAASQPLANLQDCQRKWPPALGLSHSDYSTPTHKIFLCNTIALLNFVVYLQHYCTRLY